MQKLNQTVILLCFSILLSCQSKMERANYQVIPLPQEVIVTEGKPFILNKKTPIVYTPDNELQKRNAEFLADYLKESTGINLLTIASDKEVADAIILRLDDSIEQKEGYELKIDENAILINGKTEAGIFYGIQTLRKSTPVTTTTTAISFSPVKINDHPRFEYRGMHLDVARHFFSADFVKRYIDILALHNINKFHWHLTDDQGWRIESKKHPKLTEIGSVRNRTVIGRNTGKYDETPYGGFYTQEEIKDVVKYAQERYITIIPEVDLPGHMLSVLAAYPEFGCTGGPYEVCPQWGIFEDVICIGNEDALIFLEEVLDEVIQLFPSELIHIGGDEAPRDRWKACPKCQARIKKEGLKADGKHTAEDRLQTYCMKRMEAFLNSKGRRIIGWDEILEGDVAPNATIMSWRGMEGGIQAARLGHDVIMVPTSHSYFDYHQTENTEDEPLAFGGLVTIEKAYSLEPVPAELEENEKKCILGAQANLWTEYVLSNEHAEYMVLPRMAALSEVQWTQPEKKNYADFSKRLPQLLEIYQLKGYYFAKHIFDLKATYTPLSEERAVEVVLSTIDNAPIYYTVDGTVPTTQSTRYIDPILITKTAAFKAVAIRAEKSSLVTSEDIVFNKATGCPIIFGTQPSDKYKFKGATTLVDGLRGNDSYATGRWIGFIGHDAEVIIDLQKSTEISRVATQALVDMGSWIMGATGLEVYTSDDNADFRKVATKDYPVDTDYGKKSIDTYEVEFAPVTTRYIKIIVKRSIALPKGHSGEGKTPFLFIDELSVD